MSSTGVSNNAFEGYETITSVSFNSNCSYVGENAFNGCVSLVEINRDNKITEIKSGAFAKTSIGSAVFNDLTTLHDGAFADCTNLSYVYMPHCSDIQSGAFMNCEKLRDIKLENCTTIGENAFYGCSSIEEVTLNKCSSIGKSAFMNCTNLKRVYITTANCSLSSNVFYISNGQNDNSVNNNVYFYFPASVFEKYTDDINSDNPWYNYRYNMVKIDVNNQIIYSTIDGKIININSDSDGSEDNDHITISDIKYGNKYGWIYFNKDLVSLNDKIFKGSTTLESLELPSSCEGIGEYAFSGCENLKSIYTTKLIYINKFAFQDCKSLVIFNIPDSVTSIGEGAFAGCKSLEKFDGKSALLDDKKIICNNTLICVLPSDNTRIYNISEIDKDITRLGAKCFYGNNNIRRVNIPDSVTSIGDNAFDGCENLCEVHFYGNTLPDIGEALFFEDEKEGSESEKNFKPKNKNLKIFVPVSVYDDLVSDSGSKYKYYLNYIYPMPDDKNIIYYVDENDSDSELTQGYTIISNTSETLNENWWTNAEDKSIDKSIITRVIVGEGVAEIGAFAFRNFSNLTDIYLSDNITALYEGCFYNCRNLTRIHIPYGGSDNSSNGLTCGADVFYGCEKLEKFDSYYDGYVSEDGRCYIDDKSRLVFFAQGDLTAGEYILPDNVISIGTTVFKDVFNKQSIKITISDKTTSIGDGAFNGCKTLYMINLPNNLTRIGDSAFDGCEILNIVDVSIPKNIKKIGNATFKGCKNITELELPENLETIGADAFNGCENLNISQIPNMVTYIEGGVFKGCKNITDLKLPEKLQKIGADAFNGCEKLNTQIPNTVTTIESSAFKRCTNLKEISLSDNNLTAINSEVFYGCTNIEISLPNNLTRIEKNAFYGCKKLNTQIPNTVTYIGVGAFEGCTSLEKLDLTNNKNIKIINNRTFYGCTSLSEVKMNDTIEKIGNYAFYGCNYLNSLNLSDKLLYIGESAFDNTSLSSVGLPSELKKMGNKCFNVTSNIIIYIPKNLNPPEFNGESDEPFGDTTKKTIQIYIPQTIINTYKSDTYWSKYSKYMKIFNMPIQPQ